MTKMVCYKSKRPVDGKSSIWIIVDETGRIVSRSPTRNELEGLEKEIILAYARENSVHKYNETDSSEAL